MLHTFVSNITFAVSLFANMNDTPLFVGIDVGGTNTKIGVVSDRGEVVASSSFPTHADQSPELAIDDAARVLEALLIQTKIERSQIAAVGLGTPGPMNLRTGMILTPTNMPGWRHFPIRDRLSEALQLPVTFTNDANAAGFGEFWVGSARDSESLIFLTLGTGVGGGIIVQEFCIEGVHGLGAELGHVKIDNSVNARVCSCGRVGHLEAYASATALVARALDRLRHENSSLGELDSVTAHDIYRHAEAGDALAKTLIDETADYLGMGIEIFAHTIDPDMVLLGGAMNFGGNTSLVGQRFLGRIREHVRKTVFPEIHENMKIDFARLAGNAGYIGAAGLARLRYQKNSRK